MNLDVIKSNLKASFVANFEKKQVFTSFQSLYFKRL